MFAPYAFRSVMLALCAVFVLAVPAAAFDVPAVGAVDAAAASELIRSVRPTVLDVCTASSPRPCARRAAYPDGRSGAQNGRCAGWAHSCSLPFGQEGGKGLEPAACRKTPAGNLVSDGKALLRNQWLVAFCGLMRTIHFYPRGAAHA